eukprot:Skav215523  [mRNA]  locus=scaffold219:40648:45468:+ [translate_table: standard]
MLTCAVEQSTMDKLKEALGSASSLPELKDAGFLFLLVVPQQIAMNSTWRDDGGRTNGKVDASRFFGSRGDTEAKENLTYPPEILSDFDAWQRAFGWGVEGLDDLSPWLTVDTMGLFNLASSMGYITCAKRCVRYAGGLAAAQQMAVEAMASEIQAQELEAIEGVGAGEPPEVLVPSLQVATFPWQRVEVYEAGCGWL